MKINYAIRALHLLALSASFFSTTVTEAAAAPSEPKAFVYTELQISAPFDKVPWQQIDTHIKAQPGFLNKTWLSGLGNQSAGGFYAFDSIEHAELFVVNYFPTEARKFGVAQTSRVFDAHATEDASKEMNSVHYQGKTSSKPGAFVYTEVQLNAQPFATTMQWKAIDAQLKQQPGLLAKTWLSGVNTGTPGGFYAFDTIEHAQQFVLHDFPNRMAELKTAFYTRVFDATITEAASRDMHSPFYE